MSAISGAEWDKMAERHARHAASHLKHRNWQAGMTFNKGLPLGGTADTTKHVSAPPARI